MPAAADLDALPDIEADELAWLATLDDVESRLVFTESRDGKTFYRMESGPFDAAQLESLPEKDWTLLIQDVEKHLPALRRFFDLVPFVPDWRIDDLMISVAAPGGSVGPHVDNYDVFLVQTRGHRLWEWTSETLAIDEAASDQMKLVQPFTSGKRQAAGPGDILYLNPGVAHHGVASELCITCSIGMRAPQLSELSGRALDNDDAFYTDADLGIGEVRPGYLSPAAIGRAARLLEQHDLDAANAEILLGRFATAPKQWLCPESPDSDLPADGPLDMHGMARVAWSDRWLFANGLSLVLPPGCHERMAALAGARAIAGGELADWLGDPKLQAALEWLWRAGLFDTGNQCSDAI
jgi:50S ribosomal protein L16 3-hydroxylase